MRIAGALMAILALAACEDGTPEQQTTTVRAANPVSDQLKAMGSDVSRYLGLRRGVVDNGGRCKRVDRGAYQQDYKNMAMWTAHCTDTGDWAVFIAPNGDVQARKCAEAKLLRTPECRPMPAGTVTVPEPKGVPTEAP
jgi:hypothetical protein